MKSTQHILTQAGAAALALSAALHSIAAPAFVPDNQPVGYVGQPTLSSVNVSNGDAKMYTIDYKASDWTGNLHAYPVSSAGTIGSVDDWGSGGAAAKIKAQSVADTRLIVTSNGGVGVPFRWASLSNGAGGQRQALDALAYGSSATSSPVLDYLRGSAANEGTGTTQYRRRNAGLGDIIHSTPVYWNDGIRKTVFVGANDGMLHAINALDGTERFAYVPAVLLPRLSALTSQTYAHSYFVDGRMDVRKFGTQTILTGALGAGGKALFALDVTNAAATSESDAAAKVLWEVTNASSGYADLGYTYGAPTLTTLPNGVNAVVAGNGYNSSTGKAVLYLINAQTGALIKAFDTGSGSPSSPNGLSSPSLWDSDNDGKKDTAYAGDIDGNVWKFNLTAPYTAQIVRLFTNTSGTSFAITMAPGLFAHPLGGVMVEFVTGRMLVTADATDTAAHYAYGIWDGAPALNEALLEQTLTEANYVADGVTTRVRTATNNSPNWTSGRNNHKGWRTRLPTGGERVVGDGAFVTGDVFQFFSTNPTVLPSAIPPGENWWMQINALSGGANSTTVFDLNGDKEFTSDDQVNGVDPVGRYMGGGVRSQLIALSADGIDVFQSNFDRNGAPVTGTTTVTTRTVEGQRGVSGGHFDTDFFCYRNCGASTSQYRTVNSVNGIYSIGSESGGETDALKYVHVHEYDDIYDRVGINMFHPSQDMQRLPLARMTRTTTYVPNTPTLQANQQFPSSGVTVVSTVTTTNRLAKNVPATTNVYTFGAQVADGAPSTATSSTSTVVTSRVRYTTTLVTTEAVNIRPRNADRYYPYDSRRTTREWETVLTTVDTIPNTSYKVLMANQAYSPAVKFQITGSTDVPLKTGATFTESVFRYLTASGLTAASLPTYKMNTPENQMIFSMPLDAFNIKNWGTGVSRSGLHPIRPQCAGVATAIPTAGPLGEWRNGALTVQIVDSTITDADIQMNVAGRPDLGYRLRGSSLATKLVAEYLIYWHHPNNLCMGDSGWTRSPPQDAGDSDAVSGVWAPGEADPRGVFTAGSGQTGTVIPDPPAPTVVRNSDGSITTTTITHTALADGGYIVRTVVVVVPPTGASEGIATGGSADNSTGGVDARGADRDAASLGRINWRELQK